ncbi:MAG: methylmalonyl Co-A mutase-associated GTPase MeaB [Chlorobiota bacterium]
MKYRKENIVDGILNSEIRFLSKAITLIESASTKHFELGQDILEEVLQNSGNSIRIGITGPPGVGKSTLIEALGLHYCNENYKTAVLAIDPSSKVSGGSILGDKTRMLQLSKHENSYIRPTPSSGMLGGTSARTKESIQLCEAAGFQRILVETVGVGQNEINISDLVDVLIILLNPGSGDELQGIKRGVLEVSDIIAINKADINIKLVNETVLEYKNAIRLIDYDKDFWKRKVLKISALESIGIEKVTNTIDSFIKQSKDIGFFDKNRINQEKERLLEVLKLEILKRKLNNQEFKNSYNAIVNQIENNETTAIKGAMKLLDE